MKRSLRARLLGPLSSPFLALGLAAAGCAGGDGDGDAGAGLDAGADPDGGVRSLCPIPENMPLCDSAEACEGSTIAPPQSNCEACLPASGTLCASGRCQTPPALESADLHNLRFTVDPTLRPTLRSFAQYALAAETSGGERRTCAQVYAGEVDLADPCHNLLESRGREIAEASDTYILSFSRFASGQRVLFVVRGFAEAGAAGPAIGVSCTEHDTPAPGTGRVDLPGDMMRRIN
jgi:hypothetical protein